jgi:hypothetical protein
MGSNPSKCFGTVKIGPSSGKEHILSRHIAKIISQIGRKTLNFISNLYVSGIAPEVIIGVSILMIEIRNLSQELKVSRVHFDISGLNNFLDLFCASDVFEDFVKTRRGPSRILPRGALVFPPIRFFASSFSSKWSR